MLNAVVEFYKPTQFESFFKIEEKYELLHLYNILIEELASYIQWEVGHEISINNKPYVIKRFEILLKRPYETFEDTDEITIRVYTEPIN